ncbi:uncharacterized protein si:dkey-19b23.7 isoform X2 [Triplophysa dalaica]|uniref:uncharacterized protein si:dkey-19b23.7 isoform X2 n=1 Tax=Triplophysa dalaica TaxID=1582913 RepID=UPI0024DF773D|nr:uncharacterized protein si:dkey-19b23.7 isoform X2 [Triplophysa dalaica]
MKEKEQIRRLQHFLSELAILGSLQGFHYFQPWLRGREELLLTVVNDDLRWRSPGYAVSVASNFTSTTCSSSYSLDSDYASSPLAGEEPSPQVKKQTPSATQQQTPSRGGDSHLLPASPSEREIAVPEVNCTMFLLAGYAKYGQPYAWIRSNHERLVNIGGTDTLVKDTPMKLKSITDWVSTPEDMRYLQTLSLPERFLVTGALLNFLEMIVVEGNREDLFYDMVVAELKPLRQLHFKSLSEVQRLQDSDRTTSTSTEESPDNN